jgi:glycosyltransferase involved in cell wall biosynthesis
MKAFLSRHSNIHNIELLGPVYGEEKAALLRQSQFYVLPSFSEGFPTSVLEAMQHGLVPIISPGCNFPDVFEHGLGIRVETDVESIRTGLERARGLDASDYNDLSHGGRRFIEKQYTYGMIARQQAELYQRLIRDRRSEGPKNQGSGHHGS